MVVAPLVRIVPGVKEEVLCHILAVRLQTMMQKYQHLEVESAWLMTIQRSENMALSEMERIWQRISDTLH